MFGCSSNKESNNDLAARDSILTSVAKAEKTDVIGYFDGDRVMDTVLIRILNDSNTNPDLPWSYAIEFSDPKFPPLEISPMMADGYVIINEGNLDPTEGEELSVITCA